jgi:dihydrofolate reductase (trimethoprim resistance protein)
MTATSALFTQAEVDSIVKLRIAQFQQRKGPYSDAAPLHAVDAPAGVEQKAMQMLWDDQQPEEKEHYRSVVRRALASTSPSAPGMASVDAKPAGQFKLGDLVTKTKGSSWTGRVVGTYSTALTPEGYAVESSTEHGSVQIYPVSALAAIDAACQESK